MNYICCVCSNVLIFKKQAVPSQFLSKFIDPDTIKDKAISTTARITTNATDYEVYVEILIQHDESELSIYGPGWWTMREKLNLKVGQWFVLTAVSKGVFNVVFFEDDGSALTTVKTYSTVVKSSNALRHIGDEEGDFLMQ